MSWPDVFVVLIVAAASIAPYWIAHRRGPVDDGEVTPIRRGDFYWSRSRVTEDRGKAAESEEG